MDTFEDLVDWKARADEWKARAGRYGAALRRYVDESAPEPYGDMDPDSDGMLGYMCRACGNADTDAPSIRHDVDCLYAAARAALDGGP